MTVFDATYADDFARGPLGGARIWISGSVPETDVATEDQRTAIVEFVKQFAAEVFRRGGHVVHGSHPSLTPGLLEVAANHRANGGRVDSLMLVVSRLYSKDRNLAPADDWRKSAVVYETAEVAGEHARDESLALLRKSVAAHCDAIVVVGGKAWKDVAGRAGVPIELHLAMERGLPCFVVGGLGGAARQYVEKFPQVLARLKNGLDLKANQELWTKADVPSLVTQISDALQRLPLVRGRGAEGAAFRILALDGGGLKGAFTASVLATWEAATNLRIVDHFDLIAGTSTGGILAIGLGRGLSASQMLDFYVKRGPKIFPVTRLRSRIRHTVRHVFRPKYAQTVLFGELQDAYDRDPQTGMKTAPVPLRDSLSRLVIPAYHAAAGESYVFRTPHHPNLTGDANTLMASVALATAAAPTFFTVAQIANQVTKNNYLDGGVWANSPAMAAIIEAVCFLRIPLERIEVLSVGTTDEPFTIDNTRSGVLGWLWKKRILDLLMQVQQESSVTLARRLVGEPRFLRVNKPVVPGEFAIDSVTKIGKLAQLGNQEASKPEILAQVKARFVNGIPVMPWQRY